MISKKLMIGGAFIAASMSTAVAAPITIGGTAFDTDNAATSVTIAQGGVFTGLPQNRLSVGDSLPAVEGYDLDTSFELDNNGTQADDVVAAAFNAPLSNGAGYDFLVFEILNQPDAPTFSLTLGGPTITGVLLEDTLLDTDGDGDVDDPVAIFGFDLSDLNLAQLALINGPIFIGRDVGTPDIAAIVGLNFAPEVTDVPLPAAAPLFLMGLGGLTWSRKRRKA